MALCTVTIDGTKFDALSGNVTFSTPKDHVGMPTMGSLNTDITVYVDFHDDQNMPNSTLKKLFEMAQHTSRKDVKDMKIEYWKDNGKQDALVSYTFKGWISRFQTSNPVASTDGTVNHMLVLDLEPALNQQNFKEVKLGN